MIQSAHRFRFGIDAHAIGERATGNERFISNVLLEMGERSEHELVLFFTDRPAAASWAADGWQVRLMRPRHPAVRIPFVLPRLARRERLDALLVQYAAPRRPGCPVVSVVHDVSFAEHPEWFSRSERVWMPRVIGATILRADAVVTVSEFSRGEIERRYRRTDVDVVHDAPDPALTQPRGASESSPYLLFVGTGPRKDLPTILRALHERPGRRLLVVGRPDRVTAEERSLAKDLDVGFVGYVDDDRLAALIQHATALLYPTRYEGFGLPVIEAMAVGTPVLASDVPAIREVAGDAACLVAPGDVGAWASAMARLDDPAWRERLASGGPARAARFRWDRSAEDLLGVLERVATRGGARS